MSTLTIRWQRLLDEKGETCPRCGGTQAEVEKAVRSLRRRGVAVRAVKKALTWKDFARDPAASNRIWVAGKPLERWLGARAGVSPCCGACGDNDCRTVTVGGRSYDTIPARLIVSAGLKAAAGLTRPARGSGGRRRSARAPRRAR